MASALLKKEITSLIECSICMKAPYQSHIYQCVNGHIICEQCRNRTLKTQSEQSLESDSTYYVSNGVQYMSLWSYPKKHKCPTCRTDDFDTIIRNTVAEKLVKYATFPCENLGCDVESKEVRNRK